MSQSQPTGFPRAALEQPTFRAAPHLRTAALFLSLFAGGAFAIAMLPAAFRVIPNDLSRIDTILDALHGSTVPKVVVLGDSRGETDFDAALLRTVLPLHPLAYNLSWHSQSLAYGFLLYQELPRSVGTVVQMVSLEDLMTPAIGDSRVYEALRAYGYVPTETTMNAMELAFGIERCRPLHLSPLEVTLRSRWGVRQIVDQILRASLRRDLRVNRERDDLFHPNAYTQRMDAGSFRRMMQGIAIPPGAPPITGEKLRLLQAIGRIAAAHRIRVVLVLPPVYSGAVLSDYHSRVEALRRAVEPFHVEVLDLTLALPDSEFVDPLHASVAGSSRATLILARQLRLTR